MTEVFVIASAPFRPMTVGFLLCVPVTASAYAQPASATPPAQISIENGRKVSLIAFEIVTLPSDPKPGGKAVAPTSLLKLDAPLAAGDRTTLKLRGAKGCRFLARWRFDDASDEGAVDLCGDPKIVLTD